MSYSGIDANDRGRQGARGRTHLVSPVMAAAAALTGRLTDIRRLVPNSAISKRTSASLDVDHSVTELESDEDVERVGDYPQDGQQTGSAQSKAPSSGATGMPPFTTLRGIGKECPVLMRISCDRSLSPSLSFSSLWQRFVKRAYIH